MSKKNEPKSHLPDQFQVTDGYNYGLDGFQFDTEMGGGVLNGARLPEVKGLSSLPNDMVSISEGSDMPSLERTGSDDLLGDLTGMMEENSLAELGWLHGVQDPDRLPKNPVDRGIMELEKQWSVGNATNGIIPNRDKEIVDFELSLQKEGAERMASDETLTEVVFHAHRKSAMGYPIEDILSECMTRLGDDISAVSDDLEMIKEEHGLAGNVFVYASAFPGIQNGKWKKLFKKLGCRYLVSSDKSLSSFTDMEIVESVNWEKAFKQYLPRLRLEGRKFAKGFSVKETLRLSFLSHTVDKSPALMKEVLPVERKVVDTISRKDAFEKLPTLLTEREVVDTTERDLDKLRRSARLQIAKWVRASLLSREQGINLGQSGEHPSEILRTASEIISASKGLSEYSGESNQTSKNLSDRNTATASRRNAQASTGHKDLLEQQMRFARVQVGKWVSKNLLSKKMARQLILSAKDGESLLRTASDQVANSMRKIQVIQVQKTRQATYSGTIETQHIEERTQVDVEGETRKANNSNLRKATSWLRKQMCEGMIGTSLTQLISVKFSSVFLEKHSSDLEDVRKSHEGLSGHIYIDAEAYSTEKGTKGCEKGALIHRANKVACVKAMSKCSTCVFANRNARGDTVCQKYNKPLIDDISVEDIGDYQQEMIRMANASDAEQTASLFAPNYKASDYSLGNSALDNFDYEDNTFEGNLAGLFFGGMEIE